MDAGKSVAVCLTGLRCVAPFAAAGGGASVALGMILGCTLTIVVEDDRVASAETGGGMCWAVPI